MNKLRMVSKWTAVLLSASVSLIGCSSSDSDAGNSVFRIKGIQQAALAYGAQHGLAWQSKRIVKACQNYEAQLNRIYDFNAMIMRDNILPPILDQNGLSLEMTDNDTLTLSHKTIQIVEGARFVTTPPSWRDYLEARSQSTDPSSPPSTLLPQSAEEREAWDEYVQKGWENGYYQANEILRANLGHLTRDFVGMSLFHALYAQNMVSRPFVANAKLGITGDANQVHIDQQISRIVAHAQLKYRDTDDWQPAIVHEPSASADVEDLYKDPTNRIIKLNQNDKAKTTGKYRGKK